MIIKLPEVPARGCDFGAVMAALQSHPRRSVAIAARQTQRRWNRFSAHRAHWYRLAAKPAQRVAILGCFGLVDRRTAVRAVRRHSPGRTDSSALTSRRLPFRLLLVLDVIVQRALLQRRHVNDDLAPVRGVVANGNPLAERQGKLDLGYPVRVAELLRLPYLREAPRLLTAGRWLVKIDQFLAELGPLSIFEFHGKAHLRYPGVGGRGLALHHRPLGGGSRAEELFSLGRGHRPLLTFVMMKQFLNSPRVNPRAQSIFTMRWQGPGLFPQDG